MNQQVQELLKKKDIQGSLEVLKSENVNAKLVYADYLNERKNLQMQCIDEEAWQAYLTELYIRVKQLAEEEDNEVSYSTQTRKGVNKKFNSEAKKVFISYNHMDYEIVNRIAHCLEGHIDHFVDYISMDPGDIIKERVSKEIMDRDYFLILLSKNSLTSPWVCLEGVIGNIKAQWMKAKFIPIRADDSLNDNKFLISVAEQIARRVKEIDADIEKIKTYSLWRKYLDSERELYSDFLKHHDTMIDTYRKIANINISGDLFDKGIQDLIHAIK